MYSRFFIFHEILPVAIGHCICTAAMMMVFLLAGSFDQSVLLGGIAGSLISLANFFLMTLFVNMAAEKAAHQDVAGGQKLLRQSYLGRMTGLLVTLAAFAKSGRVHVLALALPLLFVRPILAIRELFRGKGGY